MRNNRIQSLALTALCVALTAISARISFPLPIPGMVFSAQVCVVLCCGLLLGPWYGALSQGVYLLIGLIGLPVFTQGGGLAYVLKPTFCYLLSFPLAAWVCGRLAGRAAKPGFARLLCAALLGLVAVYVVALPALQLQARLTAGKLPAMGAFLWSYCAVFLPVDALKALLAATLCRQVLWRLPARQAG
jgi:biotin transport system substrate-specific component